MRKCNLVYGVSWSKLDTGGNVMKPSTTTAITTVKQKMKLREWAEQSWCAENGMNIKTYYYHLRKVREQCVESVPEIVPLTMPQQTGDIHIEKNGLQIQQHCQRSKIRLLLFYAYFRFCIYTKKSGGTCLPPDFRYLIIYFFRFVKR